MGTSWTIAFAYREHQSPIETSNQHRIRWRELTHDFFNVLADELVPLADAVIAVESFAFETVGHFVIVAFNMVPMKSTFAWRRSRFLVK